jgi:5'-nucleotidase
VGGERLILIANDDGVNASGLMNLVNVASRFGHVIVAAPAEGMSGMSHAITIKTPLRARRVQNANGIEIYSCLGTPVDCVKLALNQLLPRKPDLLLAGINHGSNSSSSIVYSGTMAIAIEGCINLIPSAGFSLLDYRPEADFTAASKIAEKVISNMIEKGLPEGVCLNVNIPASPLSEMRGVRVCRQTKGMWKEEFVKRIDPHNGEYFWLTGTYFNQEEDSDDTDEYALKNGYVSIVPVQIDLTAYRALPHFKDWDLNSF